MMSSKASKLRRELLLLPIYMVCIIRPSCGEDPEAFRPERFSKEEKKKHHPYAFIPFGGGPRLCIGNNFALMEMKLILARMVNRYEFNLAPGQEVRPLPLITLRPENGIRIEVRKRDFMAADKH
jgi:cytochrome P450